MSNDGGLSIWIGDLDGYIDIDSINYSNKREEEENLRRYEFDEIGDIILLNGKSIASHRICDKNLEPSEWRWATHQAELALDGSAESKILEQELVRSLILLGRPYAIARYAKWENVPHPSALTASLPFGFRALLAQYLEGQGLRGNHISREHIRTVLHSAATIADATAYHRAGIVQRLIHNTAQDVKGPDGPTSLDREATRTMLSLARLHFSVLEISYDSFANAAALASIYAQSREADQTQDAEHCLLNGRHLSNWRLRHLRPLSDLFPFSIRFAFERGISHRGTNTVLTREIAVNELALAHCGLLLMRRRR